MNEYNLLIFMETLLLLGTLLMLIVPLFLLIVLIDYFWRLKYVDKKTGKYKCGICGRTPTYIYLFDTLFHRAYHCKKHAIKDSVLRINIGINEYEEDEEYLY
jgi:hypothetical protein